MHCHHLNLNQHANGLTLWVRSQQVRELACYVHICMLIVCGPGAIRKYVISLESQWTCWRSCGLGLPQWVRDSVIYAYMRMLMVSWPCLQFVCDLITCIQILTLTISRPQSAISEYVASSFGFKTICWLSYGFYLPLGSKWSHCLGARVIGDGTGLDLPLVCP